MSTSKVQSLVHHLQDGKFWTKNIISFCNIFISLWALQVKTEDYHDDIHMYYILSISLLRWKNDEIEVIRSNNPQVGKALVLAVRHRGRSKQRIEYY